MAAISDTCVLLAPKCKVSSKVYSRVLPQITTASEADTIALGRRLAAELKGVVLLIGNLGAGKTTLVKGIAEGMGAAAED